VIVDEFNASGRTARAMISVLKGFGLRPMAYIPVLNRLPAYAIEGVPIHALYEVPSPRR
jgi:orotate phosphoribosyltransferase-like protein